MSKHLLCYLIFFRLFISVLAQQPTIFVTPDSISEALFTGQSSQRMLTISNSGSGNLSFDISVEFPSIQQNYALQFDGMDDHVDMGAGINLVNSSMTLEAWAKRSVIGFNYVWGQGDPFTNLALHVGFRPNNVFTFAFYDNDLDTQTGYTGLDWHHWACSFEESTKTRKIYRDGLEVADDIASANFQGSGTFYIGMAPWNDAYFCGIIDEVRVWNVARTQTEIQMDMNKEILGLEPGLIGYWRFNEGAGSTTNDQTLNQNNGTLQNGVNWMTSSAPINPDWLTHEPDSGIVIGGFSQDVTVVIDASGLEGGNYDANIIISSNDPINPQLSVPVNLQVTSAPDIITSDDTLDFGGHFVGATVEKILVVSNRGFDPLIVSDIISSQSDYTVNTTNFTLNPYESQEVVVTFVPGSVGNLPGNLTIYSNDPDEPQYTVNLLGEGLIPPSISVSPISFNDNLLSGKTAVHNLTINNSGGSDLNFDIRMGNVIASGRINKQTLFDLPIESRDDKILTSENSGISHMDYCPSGYQPLREFLLSAELTTESPNLLTNYNLNLLLITSRDYPTEIQGLLLGFPDISAVDIYDAYSAVPTLNYLMNYDVAIVMNNPPFGNPMGLGDVLADYADAGGGIILTAATSASGWEIQGRLLNEGYLPFNVGYGPAGSSSLGTFNASHPIMYGVTAATGDLLTDLTVASGAELVAEWNNGFPFVAAKGRNVAAINIYVTNPGYWTGDISEILHNAVCWSIGAGWISAEPSSGTVSANSSMEITITFDANGMSGGSYSADVIVASNDPINPEVTVPVQLGVTDAPAFSVENDTVDFGEVFLGVTDTLKLVVENKGSMDLLIFSATVQPMEYSIYPPFAGVDPGEIEEFTITFLSQVVGNYPGTLTFSSNDPELGNYQVVLTAQAVEPPVIMVTPSSLSQTLGPGQTANQMITISNAGGSNLNFVTTSGSQGQNYALQFDGIDDYVSIPEISSITNTPLTNFTFEGWISFYSVSTQTQQFMEGHTSTGEINIETDESTFGMRFHLSYETGSEGLITQPMSPNQWYHVAATYDGNMQKLYLNGILEDSVQRNNTFTLTTGFSLGKDFEYDIQYLNGIIDEVRIWDIARPLGEIQSNMSRRLTGMEPGLVGYWPLNEGSGNTTIDFSINNNHGSLFGGVTWILSTAPILPGWLTLEPDSGICLPGTSNDITVTFNSTDLDTGEYDANIFIDTNDPILPQVTVPVQLLVANTVGIVKEMKIPKEFKLCQNYPNPFNPTTVISWQLPVSSPVKLTIYSMTGQKVAILVDRKQPAGSHSLELDASGFASGVYLYRLEAEGYVQTRKMILMK